MRRHLTGITTRIDGEGRLTAKAYCSTCDWTGLLRESVPGEDYIARALADAEGHYREREEAEEGTPRLLARTTRVLGLGDEADIHLTGTVLSPVSDLGVERTDGNTFTIRLGYETTTGRRELRVVLKHDRPEVVADIYVLSGRERVQ